MRSRHSVPLLAVVLLAVATGCSREQQPGDPAAASAAANDFLEMLTRADVQRAWDVLTPSTQEGTYNGDRDAFAADVRSADWSAMHWRAGPVSDYEISWGVRIEVSPEAVPTFLTERKIAGVWDDNGLLFLIQIHEDGSYSVAGQGMDEAPE